MFRVPVCVLTLCSLMLFASPPVSAAPPAASVSQPSLDLTPDQQTAYNARVTRARQQYNDIQNNKALSIAQKKAKTDALSKQVDADTLALLTPPQKAFVLHQRAATAAFRKSHAAQIAAVNALQSRFSASVTPAQKAQMEALVTQNNADIAKIAADTSHPEADRQAQAAAVRQATNAKIKAVLTPAQAAQQKQIQDMENTLAQQAKTALSH